MGKISIKKYEDGITFLKDGVEIAFYSYITNRVTFYSQSNDEWCDFGCSSIKVEDLIFITNIIKIERKKLVEVEISG